jgi:excisionase family DNA binding protein
MSAPHIISRGQGGEPVTSPTTPAVPQISGEAIAQALGVLECAVNQGSPPDLQPLVGELARLIGTALVRTLGDQSRRAPEAAASDRLLSVPTAATLLGFKPQYVYELIRRGQLPAVQIGKYVRVRLSALDGFMKTGPINPLDVELYQRYSARRGRRPAPSAPKAGATDSSWTRRSSRRGREHGRPMGTEREEHL